MKRKADQDISCSSKKMFVGVYHNPHGDIPGIGELPVPSRQPANSVIQQAGAGETSLADQLMDFPVLPQIDFGMLPPNPVRMPTFFLPPQGKHLNNTIWIRKYLNENSQMFEIHWMKENLDKFNIPYCMPSRQHVSAFELDEFILKLKELYDEIRSVRTHDILPRFLYNKAGVEAKEDSPEYWGDGICEWVSSKILRMRPVRTKTGVYLMKIIRMYPEPVTRNGKTSLGVKVTLDMKTTDEFLAELIRLRGEIENEEMVRITAAGVP